MSPTLLRGWPGSGRKSPPRWWEEFDETIRWTFQARDVGEARIAVQRSRRFNRCGVHRALHPFAHNTRAKPGLRFLARAGPARPISRGANTLGHLSKPPGGSIGRGNRKHPLLGASSVRGKVPGLRDQLRASRLPGPLVPAVRPVHVSLSWWRLLFGRLARVGTAGARPVRI